MEHPPHEVVVIAYRMTSNVSIVGEESFDDESICSMVDEEEDDDMSIPAFIKEHDMRMPIGHSLEEDTTTTAMESASSDDYPMAGYYQMEDYDESVSSAETVEMRYNVTDITCPLCNFSVDGGEAIVLPNCGHSICVACLQQQIKSSQRKCSSVCCSLGASQKCCKPLNRSLVRQIMATEIPGDSQFTPKPSAAPSCYHRCPGKGCTNVVYWKEGYGPPIGDCFQCNRTSCLKCGVAPYHHQKTCAEYQDSLTSLMRPHHVEPMLVIDERSDRNTRRCSL